MSVDLNLDMGAIIKGFMAKQSGGMAMAGGAKSPLESYKIAIGIFAAVLVVSLIYIFAVYIPMQEKNSKKAEELNKIIEMKNQLSVLDGQINTLKKKLDKSKEEYIESLAHFGNSEDLGALYQTVSALAAKYNLVVLNVKEVTPPPVKVQPQVKAEAKADAKAEGKKEGADAKKDGKPAAPAAPAKPKLDVREIKVDVEIKGHYGEYIKFKEDLALAEILLKINTESIMVKNEATEQGSIYVKLNLSTYAIDKKPFQGIITDKTNEKTN